MKPKTSTKQQFAGRRVKLGMIVIVEIPMPHPGHGNDLLSCWIGAATCAAFEGDEPMFSPVGCAALGTDPRRLEFVESEAQLDVSTWTWPERV